jgi:hypothetical protein
MLLDADLALPGLADFDILESQDFGAAVFVNPDCCDHCHSPSINAPFERDFKKGAQYPARS